MSKRTVLGMALIATVILAVGYSIVRRLGSRPPAPERQNAAAAEKFQKQIQDAYAIDKDFDGLTDEEEKKYGTNQNLADTDGDGKLDYDEIKKFHTNPLAAGK